MTRRTSCSPWRDQSNRSPAKGKSPDGDKTDLPPGLYLVATPIGHARDISLRALDTLAGVDVIAAEDTRVTAKLLAIHAIAKPLAAYNDHNAPHERPKLLKKLHDGARVALVSDAGTPLISDPGFKLVREAVAAGIVVTALPGASAALTALSLSGLPTDRFLFVGFLASKSGERRRALAEVKDIRASLIVYEAPQRLAETLADMADVLGPRPAAVARELTKLHEEVRRAPLDELAQSYAAGDPPKGEIALVVAPPQAAKTDFAKVDAALAQALPFMPVRAAADLIAELTGAPRRAVYERALEMKRDVDQV
jgi:16S rRNA (cytidine1402-2'-O)-methyltransferase